jgi:hypothetical protein
MTKLQRFRLRQKENGQEHFALECPLRRLPVDVAEVGEEGTSTVARNAVRLPLRRTGRGKGLRMMRFLRALRTNRPERQGFRGPSNILRSPRVGRAPPQLDRFWQGERSDPMANVICVRDVVRARMHQLGPSERALRVPYDLFKPTGHIIRCGDSIAWEQGEEHHSARFAEAALGDCNPGERILLRLSAEDSQDQWWLCEVESVDDVAGAS